MSHTPRFVLLVLVLALAACDDSPGTHEAGGDGSSPAVDQGPGNDAGLADAAGDGPAPTGDGAPQPGARKKTSLGMGLSGIADWSTQYPFLDLMRWSRPWKDWDGDSEITDIDDDGWIKSLAPGQTAGTVFLTVPKGTTPPYERFVVRWKGKGTISYGWSAKKVGDVPGGGDLIEVGADSCLLRIEATDPGDPLREISIVAEPFVARYDQGERFNPDWLERIKDFRALRFMDWMATNGSEQQKWADRPKPTDRTWAVKGVPAEVMIELANLLDADPWLNVPHLADEGYTRELAKLVRDRLEPQLRVFVEHSNEVWNWGFAQAQHANTAGRARWGDVGNAYMQWHGMRTAEICDIWKQEVFAVDPQRVRCVLGTQAGWQGLEAGALDCPKWVAEQPGRKPCYQHGIDALAITGYFSGCLHGKAGDEDFTETIRSWFGDADKGVTKGLEQAERAAHFPCGDSVEGNLETYKYFAGVAQGKGLALLAYEGGQHITGNGHPIQGDPQFVDFHLAVNRAAGMKDLYLKNFGNWQQAGGELFMHFVDIGNPSEYGSWGALEAVDQPTSPRWEAIVQFNQTPCWWSGC